MDETEDGFIDGSQQQTTKKPLQNKLRQIQNERLAFLHELCLRQLTRL